MNRPLALIILTVALCAPAGTAHAEPTYTDTPAPASWTGLLGSAAAVWDSRYPDCPGGVQVKLMHDDAFVAARAQQPGCQMWINDTQIAVNPPATVKCKVLAHEWGHLLGHPHTPGGVMDATELMYKAPMGPCEALATGAAPLPLPSFSPAEPTAQTAAPVAEALPAPPPTLTLRRARAAARRAMGRRWKLTECGRLEVHVIACTLDERAKRPRSRVLTISTRTNGNLHMDLQTFAAEPAKRTGKRRKRRR